MTLSPLLLSTGMSACAAGMQAKSRREPLAAIEVERPLILGSGWVEVGVGHDQLLATGAWSGSGEPVRWEDTRWTYTTEHLDLRYGVRRHAEVYGTVPAHYARLTDGALGTDNSTFGLGDVGFGWRQEWYRRNAPLTSLITDLSFTVPTGRGPRGSLIIAPPAVGALVWSGGMMSSGLAVRGKQQLGAFACTIGVGYLRRWSTPAQFVGEAESSAVHGRLKPGDEVYAAVEPLLQLGPIATAGEVRVVRRALARSGTTEGGLLSDPSLAPIHGSDGRSFVVGPSVTLNASRGVDLRGSASVPLRGEDLTLFPQEELTPTRGVTWSVLVEVRR